ncbi:MAG: recombinase family protein [Patescibacteria group bacterium]|nr:recombinase family protein [Patescibacteria group bacterium]
MRVVTYRRVSLTDGRQDVANQQADIERWLAVQGDNATLVQAVADKASSMDERPGHDHVLKLLRDGKADTLLVWSLDRWGRQMTELILELDEFAKAGWRFVSLRDSIDLGTAAGRMQAHMTAAFANFEHDRMSERTKAGLERAVRQGKKLGRPRVFHMPGCAAEQHRPCTCGNGSKSKGTFPATRKRRGRKARKRCE